MIVERASGQRLAAIVELEEAFAPKERWSEASWRDELRAAGRTVLVAIEGDAVLGVVVLAEMGDVRDLLRIVVAPSAQRRGVGESLMRAALAPIDSRVLLEVRDDNEPAKRLYMRHGFVPIDRRRDYYASGQDALILERPKPEGALL